MPREGGASSTPWPLDSLQPSRSTGSPAFAGDDSGVGQPRLFLLQPPPIERANLIRTTTISHAGAVAFFAPHHMMIIILPVIVGSFIMAEAADPSSSFPPLAPRLAASWASCHRWLRTSSARM